MVQLHRIHFSTLFLAVVFGKWADSTYLINYTSLLALASSQSVQTVRGCTYVYLTYKCQDYRLSHVCYIVCFSFSFSGVCLVKFKAFQNALLLNSMRESYSKKRNIGRLDENYEKKRGSLKIITLARMLQYNQRRLHGLHRSVWDRLHGFLKVPEELLSKRRRKKI